MNLDLKNLMLFFNEDFYSLRMWFWKVQIFYYLRFMQAIYKIKNIKTGDFYIGSSVDFTYRKWVHIKQLREGKHPNPFLQNSWNKNGEDAFFFEILEEVEDKTKLINREQYYLDTLRPRYNLCKTAGSPLGYKHTDEARANMRQAHLGIIPSKEAIAKRTVSVLGSKRTQVTINKMRQAAKNKRPVEQIDRNGIVKIWNSASEAGRVLGIQASHITSCCRGKKKTIGNFKWKYYES